MTKIIKIQKLIHAFPFDHFETVTDPEELRRVYREYQADFKKYATYEVYETDTDITYRIQTNREPLK